MQPDEFRKWAVRAAEWGADYREGLRDRPVRAQVRAGAVLDQLAASAPEQGEAMETIFADFERIVPDAMTHWQHPGFFAYFPANAAPVSVVAEHLVNAMAAQCMLWQTSPAATEMEIRVIDWLRQALGLAEGFKGVISDSASSATLAAVLTMREIALGWCGKSEGLAANPAVRVYCSGEVHTSVDRAIWVSGIGEDNLVRIAVTGSRRGMDAAALDAAIVADREAGMLPAGIVASVGGTSIGGTDDIAAVAEVAKRHGLYLHVDAAWAGSAMICPEFRDLWNGIDAADSLVFNPHKWLGAQFDCSVHFLKDPEPLIKTLAYRPEFLKTYGNQLPGNGSGGGEVVNFSEWTVPLGRRFRALKLWFLMRAHGLEDLRNRIRNHVAWSQELCEKFRAETDFEIVTEPVLSLFSFRHVPEGEGDLNRHNLDLVNAINDDGRIYLTQTNVDGKIAIRFQVGQFDVTQEDVTRAFDVICEMARRS
ncbi:MAG: aspartate aminotransferase family protein [Nitratireductor sp.]|nr:aspartate aminotransferase family protein [Nitratireductor sp.]